MLGRKDLHAVHQREDEGKNIDLSYSGQMLLDCIYRSLVGSFALIGWSLIQHGFFPIETNLHRDSLAIDGCPKDEGK